MKKVFIPNDRELGKFEQLGVDTDKYLAAKVVEILLMEGIKYPNKNYFNGEYKYIREDPTIAHSVCLVRPEAINYSDVAKYDSDLCLKLLDRNNEHNSNLDVIVGFSDSIINNQLVVKKIIKLLFQEIRKNPDYRFTYKVNNFLDNIFEGKFEYDRSILQDRRNYHFMYMLGAIEPYYVLSSLDKGNNGKLLEEAMNEYIGRYDIIDVDSNNIDNYKKRIRTYKKDNNLE